VWSGPVEEAAGIGPPPPPPAVLVDPQRSGPGHGAFRRNGGAP